MSFTTGIPPLQRPDLDRDALMDAEIRRDPASVPDRCWAWVEFRPRYERHVRRVYVDIRRLPPADAIRS